MSFRQSSPRVSGLPENPASSAGTRPAVRFHSAWPQLNSADPAFLTGNSGIPRTGASGTQDRLMSGAVTSAASRTEACCESSAS